MSMLTSNDGYLPLSLGIVYTDKLFIGQTEILPVVAGQVFYNNNGLLSSGPNLTYDSATGTLCTAYLGASADHDISLTNSTLSGSIVIDSVKGSDIQLVGGALALYQGASIALLPTASGFGGATRIMAGQGVDKVFSATPSDYSTLGGVLLMLAGASSGNAVCHMLGTPSGALTIRGGAASASATNGGSVSISSTTGSISLKAGALAPAGTSEQGSIRITAQNSGTATAGSVNIISNAITYVWPSIASAAPANGSIMLVTTSSPPVATLSFVPITGDATITSSGVLSVGSLKVLTQNLAPNSIDSTKFASKAVTTIKLATTGVSAASYTKTSLTVDTQGRLTAVSSGANRGYFHVSTSADANYTVDGTNIIAFDTVVSASSGYSLASGILTVPVDKTVLLNVNLRASVVNVTGFVVIDGTSSTYISRMFGPYAINATTTESAIPSSSTIFTTSTGNNTFRVWLFYANVGTDIVSVKQGSSFSIIEL